MRVDVSREAAGFVNAHGGRLWVWAAYPRMCCAGTPAYMHAATEAPPGLPGFTRVPAAGFELWFRAPGGIQPDVLEIALRDIYRRASLSNEGDRVTLLANPDALEFPGLGGDDRRTRVATADDRITGFATSVPAGDVIELDDLFVDPGWMRRGAGRALVADAVGIARELGAGREIGR